MFWSPRTLHKRCAALEQPELPAANSCEVQRTPRAFKKGRSKKRAKNEKERASSAPSVTRPRPRRALWLPSDKKPIRSRQGDGQGSAALKKNHKNQAKAKWKPNESHTRAGREARGKRGRKRKARASEKDESKAGERSHKRPAASLSEGSQRGLMPAPSHAAGIRARTKSGRQPQSGSGPPCGSRNRKPRKRQREEEAWGCERGGPQREPPQKEPRVAREDSRRRRRDWEGDWKKARERRSKKGRQRGAERKEPGAPGRKARGESQRPASRPERERCRSHHLGPVPGGLAAAACRVSSFNLARAPSLFKNKGLSCAQPAALVPGRCRRHVLHAAARRFERLERAREVAVLHEDIVRVIGRVGGRDHWRTKGRERMAMS